ncbi:hypothetical protein AAFF_G00054200 [Aldrovandia affinis]|uniref:Uncharacterized protein n=1 Tax=Aldrovandia affinis TaxID=143900 RepID=A0AAD7WEG6_9TELE|nr:hypothetical protein AAFF_G00054200 [Aldrovandia affinis]
MLGIPETRPFTGVGRAEERLTSAGMVWGTSAAGTAAFTRRLEEEITPNTERGNLGAARSLHLSGGSRRHEGLQPEAAALNGNVWFEGAGSGFLRGVDLPGLPCGSVGFFPWVARVSLPALMGSRALLVAERAWGFVAKRAWGFVEAAPELGSWLRLAGALGLQNIFHNHVF